MSPRGHEWAIGGQRIGRVCLWIFRKLDASVSRFYGPYFSLPLEISRTRLGEELFLKGRYSRRCSGKKFVALVWPPKERV